MPWSLPHTESGMTAAAPSLNALSKEFRVHRTIFPIAPHSFPQTSGSLAGDTGNGFEKRNSFDRKTIPADSPADLLPILPETAGAGYL